MCVACGRTVASQPVILLLVAFPRTGCNCMHCRGYAYESDSDGYYSD